MKLLALNLFVSICMFLNALGFNSYQNPLAISQQTSAAIDQTSEAATPAPTPSEPGAGSPTPEPGTASTTIETLPPSSIPTEGVPAATTTPEISGIVQSNNANFRISFKSPHLTTQNQIILRYKIGERFASEIKGAELSINLLGDKSAELFRIPVQDLKGESTITIKEGCNTGCILGVDLLQQDGLVLANDSAEIKVAESFNMAKNGGELKTKDSKISVRIGSKALQQDLNFYVLEDTISEEASHEPVAHPFFIDADTVSDGQAVNTFDEPIQLIYTYDEGEFQDPTRWSFVTFNEETGKWEYLPTEFNADNRQIIGYTNHLSEKALDYNAIDKYKFNNLATAQTSLFTGAGTYSYPINVPPGPGGLTPSIALAYSSNTVDNASELTQASWVGMGWDLDVGSITRNTVGTNNVADDTFSYSVNGAGGILIPFKSGTDGSGKAYLDYKTQSDDSYRIRRYISRGPVPNYSTQNNGDLSYWVIWDTAGNKYTFNDRFYYLTYYQGDSGYGSPRAEEVSKWMLSSITNIYGQSINYYYAKNPKHTSGLPYYKQLNVSGDGGNADVEMYLDNITYGQYQIVFHRATATRVDFEDYCYTNMYAYCSMDNYYLDQIIVKSSISGNGVYDKTVRTYLLSLTNNGGTNFQVFPALIWGYGGHTLTLTSIQEKTNAEALLPATTFEYKDGMHLTKINNGYHGMVEFVYEHVDTNESDTVPWGYGYGSIAPVDIRPSTYILGGNSTYGRPVSIVFELHNTAIYPGGLYRAEDEITDQAGIPGNFNLLKQNGVLDSGGFTASGSGRHTYFFNLQMPITAQKTDETKPYKFVINCGGAYPALGCTLDSYHISRIVTRYRVVQKKLYASDTSGTSKNISYEYGVGAVNDFAHSGMANPSDFTNDTVIHQPNTEFMGHSYTKELRSDGRTITFFNQVGVTAGRVDRVDVYDMSWQLNTRTLNTFSAPVEIPTTGVSGADRDNKLPMCPPTGTTACKDAKIYLLDKSSTQNRNFFVPSQSSYLGTQEDYIYQRDSAYLLVTSKVNTAEIGNNGTDFSNNGPTKFNSYINYITDTNYQVALPEVASLCANRDQVNVSTHFASCGTSQSNYLSEYVTLYNDAGPKSLWKTLNLLRFVTPGINVTNDYQNKAYSATKLEYDSYGNVIKSYIGSKIAPGVAIYTLDTTKCYDVADATTGCLAATYPGNYLNWEKNAKNQPTSYLYDKTMGLLTQITDPNGAVTQMGYYASGRPYWVAKPGDSSSSPTYRIGYFDNANPYYSEISVKRADGQIYLEKQNYYDGLGNLIISNTVNVRVGSRANEDANLYTHSEFDYAGRVVRQSVPDVSYTSSLDTSQSSTDTLTQYDVFGRVTSTTASDGIVTQTAYSVDVANRRLVTKVTVQNYNENHVLVNEVTETDKDVWGNIRTVVMPDLSTFSTYYYDMANRMTSYTINGVTGYITYDIGGRKLTTTDPNMGLWSYVPDDVVGKLISQSDAAGNVTHLCYDPLYRVTSKSFTSAVCPPNDPNAITYVYDEASGGAGIGQRTSMNDKSGVTHWTYDLRGRVTSISKYVKDPGNSNQNLGTYVTAYSYNPDDTQKQIAYPSDETVNFTYDRHGRQISMANSQTPGQPYLADIDFDEAGRPVTMALPSNISVSWTYYAWNVQGGRLQHKTAVMSSTTIQDLNYTYDLAGNITQVIDTPVSQQIDYTYDTLNRLKTASSPAENMVYDANNGKITSRNGVGYTYGNSAHPNAVTSYNGNSYTYNPNGNMDTRTIGGTTYTLGYDSEGHITSLAGGSVSNRYVYDGDGNLVLSVENSLKIVKLGAFEVSWNNANCNPNGTYGTGQFNLTRSASPVNCEWKTYYGAFAVYIQGATAVGDATEDGIHYLLQDNLGSNTEVVETNLTVQHNRFSPWGYSASTGVQPTDNQYTGQDRSSNSGLYFYASRWYDPVLGRFIQPDSIIPNWYNPISLDRYAYVNNNPVNGTDPTGHWAFFDTIVAGLVGGAIGGVIGAVGYFANNLHSFDSNEYWAAVGAGATAGALVGAGITLAGTPAANAMIGAGTAAITTELDYEFSNQDKFETDPFITTTTISATVGGVSAVLPPGVGGALAKGGVYIAGAEVQYATQTKSWTPEGALEAGINGGIGALMDIGISNVMNNSIFWTNKGIAPSWASAYPKAAAAYAGQTAVVNGLSSTGSGVISSIIINTVRNVLKDY